MTKLNPTCRPQSKDALTMIWSNMPYVYLLRCADGSYYVGQTVDLEHRLAAHQTGAYEGYTYSRRPVELVWHEHVQTDDQAFKLERQLKGWSRAKKQALIQGDFGQLHAIVKGERRRREKSNRPWQEIAS